MLAARLDLGSRTLSVQEVPTPEPGPGQVRIAVRAAGVCLSDVHLVQGLLSPLNPDSDVITLGHEVSGVVDALGPGVRGPAVGQRVALQAGELVDGRLLTRGVDYDGGWAEYALASVGTLVPIPDSLPFEQAAIIPDAVSTPWSAVTATGRVSVGEAVGVWGVGGLGAHAVQLLRIVGAAPIIAVDPLPAARDRAAGLGADLVIDPNDTRLADRIRTTTAGRGLAAAFDFVGAAAVRDQAIACLGRRGRLVLVGLTAEPLTIADPIGFSFRQLQIRGHYGSGGNDVADLVRLVDHGRLDLAGSISDVIPLAEAVQAVQRLERKDGNPVRLILRP